MLGSNRYQMCQHSKSTKIKQRHALGQQGYRTFAMAGGQLDIKGLL